MTEAKANVEVGRAAVDFQEFTAQLKEPDKSKFNERFAEVLKTKGSQAAIDFMQAASEETGGKAALPMWIHYMATALKGVPDQPYQIPEGVMTVKIDSLTGTLAQEDEEGIYEYFYQENPPPVLQRDLPPMEDPSDSGYPDNGFPNNMTDNPLQPQPPDLPLPPSTPQNNNSRGEADVVTRAINPSGF